MFVDADFFFVTLRGAVTTVSVVRRSIDAFTVAPGLRRTALFLGRQTVVQNTRLSWITCMAALTAMVCIFADVYTNTVTAGIGTASIAAEFETGITGNTVGAAVVTASGKYSDNHYGRKPVFCRIITFAVFHFNT